MNVQNFKITSDSLSHLEYEKVFIQIVSNSTSPMQTRGREEDQANV